MKFRMQWSVVGYDKQKEAVAGLDGVISTVHVEARAFDADYVAPSPVPLDPQPEGADETVFAAAEPQLYGVCRVQVALPAPKSKGFKPEAEIGDDELLRWARRQQGEEMFAAYEENAQADLLNKQPPTAFVARGN